MKNFFIKIGILIFIIFTGCMSLENNLTGFGWYGITLLLTPIFGIGLIIVGIKNREWESIGSGILVLVIGIIFYIFIL
jgi:hypothetical protein